MSAVRLWGPDGQPLVTTTPATVAKADESSWRESVEKRVRSTSVSLTVAQDKERGREKPTPVTYPTLRLMANRNEWVRGIIKTRKNQVSGVAWDIVVKDTDDPSGAARKAAKAMRKLLTRPMLHGSAPQSMHWRHFISLFLEDLLVLDRAAIEKERDGNGWIVALYPVDGATIRPNLNERGAFDSDAYVQVVDGIVQAKFGMEELIVAMDNPQTDVNLAGYGMSPLENLVVSVTADLHAARFNSSYFEKGAVPEGLLHLGEDVSPEDVDAFRMYWLNEIQGKPWSLPIIGGSKAPEWLQWRDSNRDMQFMEYQDWLLQKLCAVYQISKQELGATDDVNRSTADSQDSSNDRKGIQPLLALIKDMIDLEIVGEHGQGLGDYLEFQWEQTGESAEAINAKFQPMVDSGAATRAEWREAHGMKAGQEGQHGHEGLGMYLTSGTPSPLPSSEDASTMGAAAQQDRQDDQQRQQWGREDQVAQQGRDHDASMADKQPGQSTPLPWSRANADDPDVQNAMRAHDEASGVGPRNVGKTSPDGHDRNPALSRHEDDLSQVFERATSRLIDGLAQVLGG